MRLHLIGLSYAGFGWLHFIQRLKDSSDCRVGSYMGGEHRGKLTLSKSPDVASVKLWRD